MAGMDMFKQAPWMGGFVQYADPIPPGPHVYGPPPFGIWPTSVRRPVAANGAPIAPSTEAEARRKDIEREWDREKQLFIEKKKKIGQLAPVQPPPPTPLTTTAVKEAATSLLPKQVDKTMLYGGIAIAIVGVGTRIFAEEKTTSQTLASAAAIVGGIGLVYKALQLT